jgi:flavin reductase (DIM6/NTAB) family NADH-FMN oxidoreductase RutF
MQIEKKGNWVNLNVNEPIWNHFHTVAPLVVIGTKEYDHYDMAPKHMVTPLGQENFFGFVCTPDHATYHNTIREKFFTVSYIQPNQVVMASLAAQPRCGDKTKANDITNHLPTIRAEKVDALCIADAYLLLECKLKTVLDGFGKYSLIAGEIIHARVLHEALTESESDDAEKIYNMPLLAYIAYGRFAEIKETKGFPFPKDFKDFPSLTKKQ